VLVPETDWFPVIVCVPEAKVEVVVNAFAVTIPSSLTGGRYSSISLDISFLSFD
jgi:hypothetical protein